MTIVTKLPLVAEPQHNRALHQLGIIGRGIIHAVRNLNDLDEASGAYKDIDVVMANQTDLVKIKVELEPLAVVKG